jgi:hypothetical protein
MDPTNKPGQFIQTYFAYAKAGIQFAAMTLLLLAVLAASFLVLRGLWVAMKSVLRAIGA